MRSLSLFMGAATLSLVNAHQHGPSAEVTLTTTTTRTHTVCPLSTVSPCSPPENTDVSPAGAHGHHSGGGDAGDAWWSLWNAEKTKYGIWDDWNTATTSETASETTTTSEETGPETTSSGWVKPESSTTSEETGPETTSSGWVKPESTTSSEETGPETSSSGWVKPVSSTTSEETGPETTSSGWVKRESSTTSEETGPETTSSGHGAPTWGTTTVGAVSSESTSSGYVHPTWTTSGAESESSTWYGGSTTSGVATTSSYITASSSTSASASTSSTSSSTCPSYTPVANSTYDTCNTAGDRSKWCGDRSIDTDSYTDVFKTGITRQFTFEITNTTLVYDGTGPKLALAINGQVPGPVIEANWGDMIEVTVINKLQDNSTSVHFHGIRQYGTNDQDGVPGVTECAIAGKGGSRTYTWHASAYGTSWYHSHSFAQYGDGIRGPIVIHGPATANYDYDMGTLMLDDTFPITAAAMASRIAHIGPGGSFNTLFNGKNKNPDGTAPGGTPFSWGVKPCRKHLFRIINSSSQNSYIVGFDSHTMTVIAADFVPIVPYKTKTLHIANGQRYDVVVEMDQAPSSYYVRAVIQTGCPSGGANSGLGTANAIINYEGITPVTPTISTPITNVTAAVCQDEPLASLVPHLQKPAGSKTSFQASASTMPAGSVTSIATNDDGTVFQWYLNNGAINVNYSQPTLKTLAEGDATSLISNPVILSDANQWVYFIIQNQFFASHPMHVHGHDVSILGTGSGPFSASQVGSLEFTNPMRRDTVMLQGSAGPGFPAGYTVIGFETDNPGAWLMHCHITWHVDGGLALQFVERPSDITAKAYVNDAFNQECSALEAYQSANPQGAKLSGQSGLKRRGGIDADVNVGKFQAGAKMHIDKYRKRYTGRHAH